MLNVTNECNNVKWMIGHVWSIRSLYVKKDNSVSKYDQAKARNRRVLNLDHANLKMQICCVVQLAIKF